MRLGTLIRQMPSAVCGRGRQPGVRSVLVEAGVSSHPNDGQSRAGAEVRGSGLAQLCPVRLEAGQSGADVQGGERLGVSVDVAAGRAAVLMFGSAVIRTLGW